MQEVPKMDPARDQLLKIELSNQDDKAVTAEIFAALWSYSEKNGGLARRQILTITVRDKDNAIVGGLCGRTTWGWLFIEDFWLSDDLRGQGLGSEVLKKAETEAIIRGCHGSWLDTFTFHSARHFYEAHGYEIFGRLENYPDGHSRLFMKKRLAHTA
jgi:GNAT superfamily N-acetyltransferase